MNHDSSPYALAQQAAGDLSHGLGVARHEVAVVLGSGWAPAADALGAARAEVSLSSLAGFPPATVSGHAGVVRSVTVPRAGVAAGISTLVFLGRLHLYEGHSPATVVHGIRTAMAAGCRMIVLTNAAGGVRPDFRVGQPVLISDHINLTGQSPLGGPPPPESYGARFVDMTDAYSKRLRVLARDVDPRLVEGVYAAFPGPQYETPAEIRMARTLGADLVGMSTALETIAARQGGAEVLAVSLVTNPAAGVTEAKLDHREVLAAGAAAATSIGALLREVIGLAARASP